MKKIRLLILAGAISLCISCSYEKTLILVDSHWENLTDFNFVSQMQIRIYFFLHGKIPVYGNYEKEGKNFSSWFDIIIAQKRISSCLITPVYLQYLSDLKEKKIPCTLISLTGNSNSLDLSYIINTREQAMKRAAHLLSRVYLEDKIEPVIIMYGNPAENPDYKTFMGSWNSEKDFPAEHILFLDSNTEDIEGRILSFFNRFDFENKRYYLMVVAEPYFKNILDHWPDSSMVTGILSGPDHPLLPANIKYMITPDFKKMMKAGALMNSGALSGEIVSVQSLLKKR